MQPERQVRRQLRFMVPKLEEHAHARNVDTISEIYAHLQRIFAWRKIVGSNPVFQRPAASLSRRTGQTPRFRAKKSVVTAFDLVSAIQTAAILQPMKIITHDRGVICPTLIRRR